MNFLPVVPIFGYIQFSATTFSRVGLATTRYETPYRGNIFPATENDGGSRSLGKQFLSCNKSSSTEILSSSELSENENNSSSSTPARPSSSSIRSQNTISPSPTPDRDAAVMAAFRNLFSCMPQLLNHHFLVHRNPHGHRSGEVLTSNPKKHGHTIFFCLGSPQQDQVHP